MAQYQIGFDFTQPVQIVFTAQLAVVKRPVFNQLISNRDPAVTVLLGFETDRQVPDFTAPLATSVLDPLTSAVVDGSVNVWAVAVNPDATGPPNSAGAGSGAPPPDQPSVLIDVVPTSIGSSGNPVAIASAIAASGLALSIAQQIANQGISVFGNPKLLYNFPAAPAVTTLLGISINPKSYSQTNGQTTYLNAANRIDGFVGLPMATTIQKYFISTEGSFPTSVTDTKMVNLMSMNSSGTVWVISIRPTRTSNAATIAAQQTAITNFINLLAANLTNPFHIILWSEYNQPGTFPFGGVTYQQYWANYAPTVKAALPAGSKLAFDPLIASSSGNVSYQAAVTDLPALAPVPDWALADFYNTGYDGGITLDQAPTGVSASYSTTVIAAGLPLGLGEWGHTATPGRPTQAQWTAYVDYLLNFFTGWINAGHPIAPMIYFATDNNAPGDGFNDGGANMIYSSSDYKIGSTPGTPGLQQMWNAFSSAATGGTIAAAGTAVLVPLNGSPVAGYAIAQGFSYDITLNFTTGAASTRPFATVTLAWFNQDATNAVPVATQSWQLPMGTNGTAGTVITGIGPQHGQYLQLSITNNDTVTCNFTCQMNSTARNAARHDWIWDMPSSVTVPTFTNAGGAPHGNSLGSISNVNVPASGSISRLFSMFAGQVYFRCNDPTGKLTFVLSPLPGLIWGSAGLVNETPAGEFEALIVLPRSPCQVTVTNSDAANPHPANVEIVALD